MRGTLKSLRLVVAMLLSTRSSKCSSLYTRMRVYTRHRRDLLNRPYRHFTPASGTRDTRTHRFLDVCFLVVARRMLHCAQFLPPHPPTSTAVSLLPSRRHPRSRTLMQRAMQPPRRRLLLFPFFQFGWGAGSERATHSPIPFYSLPPSLPPFGPSPSTLLLAPPPQVASRRKNIYIYLFLRGLRLLLPSPRPYPLCYLLSAIPSSATTFEILSVSRTFFFFLISCAFLSLSYFDPPLLTMAPRVRGIDEEKENFNKTD